MKVYAAVGGSYSDDYRVYAIFATREAAEAFVRHPDSDADDIDERELYDGMPPRSTWHVIERTTRGNSEVRRYSTVTWDFDGPPYGGYVRKSWNYSKWKYGERAFGKNKAAVEQAWRDHESEKEAERIAR